MSTQPKLLYFNGDARRGIAAGINKLADAVKVTLGPRGRLVIISRPIGGEVISKDGVTVARAIEFSDPLENIGANLIRDVASKTVDVVGDGTTTATVLTQKLVNDGLNVLLSGADPQSLKRGMEQAYLEIAAGLATIATPVESDADLLKVATVSANDETLGSIVANAYKEVGKRGVVVLEKGNSAEIEVEVVKGMRFQKGYAAPQFVNDLEHMVSELTDVPIVVLEEAVNHIHGVLPLIESVIKNTGKRQMVLIADDFSSEVLGTFILNGSKGNFHALCIKAPGVGDRKKDALEDIAILTGATLVSESKGLKLDKATSEVAGSARKVTATAEHTTIIDGAGQSATILERVHELEMTLSKATWPADRIRLEERIAALQGGIAVIRVGAETEIAMREKYHRLEDAVHATKAAIEEGIVPGGGVALIRALKLGASPSPLTDEGAGRRIVYNAITEPLAQIARNAGVSPDLVVEKVVAGTGNEGFNARTLEYEADMIAAGVIDPAKVTRAALKSAVSIASLIIASDVAIVDEPKKKEEDNKTKK